MSWSKILSMKPEELKESIKQFEKREKNEKECVDLIESKFKHYGWETHREVIPDQCVSWAKPLRVDLLVFREDVGYIGIEAKMIRLAQGGIIAQCLKQIFTYKKFTYFGGVEIKLWAAAIYFTNRTDEFVTGRMDSFIREFFCAFGVGYYIDRGYDAWRSPWVDFAYSQHYAKISLYFDGQADIEKITESIKKKEGD